MRPQKSLSPPPFSTQSVRLFPSPAYCRNQNAFEDGFPSTSAIDILPDKFNDTTSLFSISAHVQHQHQPAQVLPHKYPKVSPLSRPSPEERKHGPSHLSAARPPDPFEMSSEWDGPGYVIVNFHNYGAPIHPGFALWCMVEATRDAFPGHLSVWNQAIGRDELYYRETDMLTETMILLSILPRATMTWNMLFYAMLILQRFLQECESMEVYFEVEVMGALGMVAKGNLTAIPKGSFSMGSFLR